MVLNEGAGAQGPVIGLAEGLVGGEDPLIKAPGQEVALGEPKCILGGACCREVAGLLYAAYSVERIVALQSPSEPPFSSSQM